MAVRLGDLHTEGGGRSKPHGRQAARGDERARDIDRELLADAVLVPADVGHDIGIGRGRLPQLAQDAFGPKRELIRGPLPRPVTGELLPATRDLFMQWSAIGVPLAARFIRQRRQRQLGVSDDPQFGLVIAADLSHVGVDVNQPGRRNREGEARVPGAGVRLGQPRADRDDQIGRAALLVRNRRAPEPRLAQQ